jgi:hypothetical protein
MHAVIDAAIETFDLPLFEKDLALTLNLPLGVLSARKSVGSVVVDVNFTVGKGAMTEPQEALLNNAHDLSLAMGSHWDIQSVQSTTETYEVSENSPLGLLAGLAVANDGSAADGSGANLGAILGPVGAIFGLVGIAIYLQQRSRAGRRQQLLDSLETYGNGFEIGHKPSLSQKTGNVHTLQRLDISAAAQI